MSAQPMGAGFATGRNVHPDRTIGPVLNSGGMRHQRVPPVGLRKVQTMMSYLRFGAMIATSTVVMFGLMYLNTYALDHVLYSQTRMWMALLMGAVMAIIMLLFMLSMYKNRRANIAILAGSAAVIAVSLWLVRSQETVGDLAYMRAMVPHHSIAIMTSERAHIRNPRVRRLADQIIEAQEREIAEMRGLIALLEREPVAADAPDLPPRHTLTEMTPRPNAMTERAATPRER